MTEVWIERRDRGGGVIELTGFARSAGAVEADFRLEIIRRTEGNSSRTRQGGHVDLEPGVARRLSVVAVGPVRSAEDLDVRLELTSGEVTLAETVAMRDPD